MKLATFEKVRTATATEYVVFHGEDVIDSFTVDYCEKDATGNYDVHKLNNNINKRFYYEKQGATVRFVDVNKANGCLSVTIEI